MIKIFLITLALQSFICQLFAQTSGSIFVQGDIGKFYPVTFYDGGFDNNEATVLTIGRSSVHIDATWRGSCIGVFRFHTNNWGNSSYFIDADIKQTSQPWQSSAIRLIAGWKDVTFANGDKKIIIWLKGGGTTYYYHSNYTVSPAVYDGVANSLPYSETNGSTHTYKTSLDSYVNNTGMSHDHTAYFNGTGINYFNGGVAIGTITPQTGAQLTVNGNIFSKKVKVTQSGWADYVFYSGYRLRPLSEVELFIRQQRHLPEVPSAAEVEKDGIDLGDSQAILLKKIEELTLYLIAQNKRLEALEKELKQLKNGR